MAETEIPNEPALPTKRKLDEDPFPENKQENHTNKSQKLESLTNNSPNTQEKTTDRTQTLEASFNNQNDTVQKVVEEEEDGDDEDGDYEDEENGEEVLVDRKGKGILIEEDEDDDSSDDDGDESSELDGGDDSEEAEEDDPLAEVDLDNILPSRTRRKAVHPGVYIANDNHVNDDDDDDDDSDAQVGDVIIEGVCLQNLVKLSSLRKYATKCCPLSTNVVPFASSSGYMRVLVATLCTKDSTCSDDLRTCLCMLRAGARQYLLARPGASCLNEPGVAVSRAHLGC
ncbi:histone H2A.Z-specific chaperone CHZ1 [Populus alba x Populus x berolinensis]|nr:histone H2A.Z-specific chaperone CHZ1 [Populus alba x Populus x berolinensis]